MNNFQNNFVEGIGNTPLIKLKGAQGLWPCLHTDLETRNVRPAAAVLPRYQRPLVLGCARAPHACQDGSDAPWVASFRGAGRPALLFQPGQWLNAMGASDVAVRDGGRGGGGVLLL